MFMVDVLKTFTFEYAYGCDFDCCENRYGIVYQSCDKDVPLKLRISQVPASNINPENN
jgi:hypothetical protein